MGAEPRPDTIQIIQGQAARLLEQTSLYVNSPQACDVGYCRVEQGRQIPSRVASVFDPESSTFFHIRTETDTVNDRRTTFIAWFSFGEHASDLTDGCLRIEQEHGGGT